MKTKFSRIFSKRNKGGFTLVEVIISTALLGILIIGMLMFITPVFSSVETNEAAAKAERTISTMEVYISKSLRNSFYVKTFTNTNVTAACAVHSGMIVDTDYQKMIEFMNKGNNKDNYQLNCIGIRYVTDNNPRNSSDGTTAQKYMLYNEYVDQTAFTIDPTKSTLIFDESFYEDLYPTFAFSHITVDLDANFNEIPETTDPSITPPAVALTLTPALIMDIGGYGHESMSDAYKVFTGKSVIQVNNIKNPQFNTKGEYKIFDNTDMGTAGTDTFVFYITRKAKATPVGP